MAITVHEHGAEKFCKVIRLMYTVPSAIQDNLNTWIVVPKQNVRFHKVLLARRRADEGMEEAAAVALKEIPEGAIRGSCELLTNGQRCADWFLLRQFRMTGTNAVVILLSNGEVRTALGLPAGECQEKSPREWFELLFNSWFSSKVSTEAMKQGIANEDAVMSALSALPLVKEVFEVGLVGMRTVRFLACSSDGVVSLYRDDLGDLAPASSDTVADDGATDYFVVASVEIKTWVAPSRFSEALSLANADIVQTWG